MSSPLSQRSGTLAAAAILAVVVAGPALAAGPVSVTVNGSALNLNPAPTERAGRVFVPLRGVFESLGATVVYADGTINATGRGHTIALHIGSQQATVDGQPQQVDVAPFIIGASTYVPLRFVSQALGASVNYDGANNIVAIATNGNSNRNGNPMPPPQPMAPPPNPNANGSPVTLGNLLPRRDATIGGNRPTIQASFENGNVDPNAVRISLDGRDVTADAYISDRGITYTPPALPPGPHEVRVGGLDRAGARFERRWSFTSGGGAGGTNSIADVNPPNGNTVSGPFTVRGRTAPGSTVTIQVGIARQSGDLGALVGNILGVSGGNSGVQNTVTADERGFFASRVDINPPSGSVLGVVITSTEPNYGIAATPVRLNLRVQ